MCDTIATMRRKLENMGLSEKEARVYLAALELGHATAEKLAEYAGVNRSTTYVQLESLMAKGLMSTHDRGKKTYFAPETPDLLRQLIYKQKNAVNAKEETLFQILPELLEKFESAGERPLVRFFPGKHGILTAREEVLRMKEKELHVILSSDEITRTFSEKERDHFTTKRIGLGIHSKAIYTNEGFFRKAPPNPMSDRRFIRDLPLTIDIRIFDNKTAIFSMIGNPFALVIESTQMTASMHTIFHFLWDRAEKRKEG